MEEAIRRMKTNKEGREEGKKDGTGRRPVNPRDFVGIFSAFSSFSTFGISIPRQPCLTLSVLSFPYSILRCRFLPVSSVMVPRSF